MKAEWWEILKSSAVALERRQRGRHKGRRTPEGQVGTRVIRRDLIDERFFQVSWKGRRTEV